MSTATVARSLSPPLDGSLTVVPGLVDWHATYNRDHPWALLASDEEHPVIPVSFLEYARATHRVAHVLRPGRKGPENERIALLINCDTILYVAMVVGMIRAGLVVSSSSSRLWCLTDIQTRSLWSYLPEIQCLRSSI